MPRRLSCADNLVLAGEMLETASQYLKYCDEGLSEDDSDTLIELAGNQIHPLKNRCAQLSKDLDEVDKRLRRKLREMSERGQKGC